VEVSSVSDDDVLFGYRLQLVDLAGQDRRLGGLPHVRCPPLDYYRWKGMVERHGLEILRPRERRAPELTIDRETLAVRDRHLAQEGKFAGVT
jgi:hypothetical protein